MSIVLYSPIRKAKRPPSPKSLEALADQMSGAIRVSFTGGITRFGARVNHDAMERAVRSGKYEKVVETIPWDKLPQDLSAFGSSIGDAAAAGSGFGANEVARGLGGRGSSLPPARGGKRVPAAAARNLSLGPTNPAIRAYVQTRTGELVQNVTTGLQTNIQSALLNARKGYGSPRDIANRLIDQQLPLNDRQASALDKFASGVTETMGPKAAQKAIDRYATQLQDQRAMMIARTEASFAANYGQQQVWQTAKDEGLIAEGAMKAWVTEANPCDRCLPLNGVTVKLEEMFDTDDGPVDGPPLHPNCLCFVSLSQ